jgi:hypothetical protein
MKDEQGENLDRVSRRISWAILQFYQRSKDERQPRFYAGDLREFVVSVAGHALAPASPDRVLRDLRKKHLLDYKVISRSQSKYEFVYNEQLELL